MARKILLADDSVTAQNMGRKILADAGYEVITVNNGSAALKKIGEQKPDLIVLDVYMPGYSGLEVCQRLKEVGETSRIPILLTVGKLEPFKTDEAKRVRADGFIVKPFEASELLSALSKLEDKIVPRGESKPGRFARATATIEEGRDRTVAADEDEGWKSRISFPNNKKKETAAEGDADDPAIYNPVNKDLRTVVEHHPAEPVKEESQERVDLGALAPEGLPKDVTPEEIAAIAAAAAQIQGKTLDSKGDPQEPPAEVKPETEVKAAEVAEVAPPTEPVAEAVSPSATFAEQAAPEKIEPAAAVSEITAVASEAFSAQHEEPVTMAAAAGANAGGSSSRWTAVSVALAPEESGISLEQEMQRTFAEFAAQTESSPTASTSAAAEPGSEPVVEPLPAIVEATVELPVPVTTSEEGITIPAAADESVYQAPTESGPVVQADVTESAAVNVEASAPISEESLTEAPVAASVGPTSEPVPAAVVEEAESTAEASEPEPDEVPAPEPSQPVPEPVAEITASSETAVSHEVAESIPTEPETKSESHSSRESDLSATTAAAWASWRRIRESGDGHGSHPTELSEDEKATAADAAMAAAAGAEKSPEDADSSSDPEISSIVDSVLADLRPKIVEEISRKLGKKR